MFKKVLAIVLIISFIFPLGELYAQGHGNTEVIFPVSQQDTGLKTDRTGSPNNIYEKLIKEKIQFQQEIQKEYQRIPEEYASIIANSYYAENRAAAVLYLSNLCEEAGNNGEARISDEDRKLLFHTALYDQDENVRTLALSVFGFCKSTEEIDKMLSCFVSQYIENRQNTYISMYSCGLEQSVSRWDKEKALIMAKGAIKGLTLSKTKKSVEHLKALNEQSINKHGLILNRLYQGDTPIGKLQILIIEGLVSKFLEYKEQVAVDYLKRKIAINKGETGYDYTTKVHSVFLLSASDTNKIRPELRPKNVTTWASSTESRKNIADNLFNMALDAGLPAELRYLAYDQLKTYELEESVLLYDARRSIGVTQNQIRGIDVSGKIFMSEKQKMMDQYFKDAVIFVISWILMDALIIYLLPGTIQVFKAASKSISKTFSSSQKVVRTTTKIDDAAKAVKTETDLVGNAEYTKAMADRQAARALKEAEKTGISPNAVPVNTKGVPIGKGSLTPPSPTPTSSGILSATEKKGVNAWIDKNWKPNSLSIEDKKLLVSTIEDIKFACPKCDINTVQNLMAEAHHAGGTIVGKITEAQKIAKGRKILELEKYLISNGVEANSARATITNLADKGILGIFDDSGAFFKNIFGSKGNKSQEVIRLKDGTLVDNIEYEFVPNNSSSVEKLVIKGRENGKKVELGHMSFNYNAADDILEVVNMEILPQYQVSNKFSKNLIEKTFEKISHQTKYIKGQDMKMNAATLIRNYTKERMIMDINIGKRPLISEVDFDKMTDLLIKGNHQGVINMSRELDYMKELDIFIENANTSIISKELINNLNGMNKQIAQAIFDSAHLNPSSLLIKNYGYHVLEVDIQGFNIGQFNMTWSKNLK